MLSKKCLKLKLRSQTLEYPSVSTLESRHPIGLISPPVNNPIMNPVTLPLPEFDSVGYHDVATPIEII